MQATVWRGWVWAATGAAGALCLFASYLTLRGPGVWEQVAVLSLVLASAVAWARWGWHRGEQRTLRDLSERVAALRENPSLRLLHSLPVELGPLCQHLETLGNCYRQALADLAEKTGALETVRWEQQQAEAALQSVLGRADAEQGQSIFRVRHGSTSSRTMVGRLAPNLHWMAATPAWQQFLGRPFSKLNARSFLEGVHAEDSPGLMRVFAEALETGEGHNITFRMLGRGGKERHVQMDVLTRYTTRGKPLHFRCHFLDITDRVRTEQELRRRTEELSQANAHLQQTNRDLERLKESYRDLANALRAKAEELQQANTQLRRINRELDDFTYVVSHDLKEPLRTLEAFSSFLADDYGGRLGEEGQEYISHLIQASRRLRALIDDLLTLSRAGHITNAPQEFDLTEALDTVRTDLADLIQRKGAAVRAEGPLPRVAGDPQRIAQLLANLVGNGLKYNTSAAPEVVIGEMAAGKDSASSPATRHPPPAIDFVTLYVRDNGIGIAPAYHKVIFRIFRRLHRREDYEGTGAGLAICKKIIEAHGGRLWVESQPDRGATFFFTLPRPGVPINGLASPSASGGAAATPDDSRFVPLHPELRIVADGAAALPPG